AVGGFDLLRHRAWSATKLQGGEAIAVDRRRHVGAGGLECRPNRPADLAMRFHTLAGEAAPGRQDEVSGHSLPHEVELVALVPHVVTRTGDSVRLPLGVIERGSPMLRRTDVGLRGENAELV